MHISSLPSEYGIGDVGESAFKMADLLKRSGISLWQILPTGPTGYGDSPYASRSAFAGNELFISVKKLYLDGLLDVEDILRKAPYSERVDYGQARSIKMPLLFKAAERFLSLPKDKREGFAEFREENREWLEDYALFQALCAQYNDSRWYLSWPKELRVRDKDAIDKAKTKQKKLMDIYQVLQYFFHIQWKEFRAYVNSLGIELIGDIPIFVASDSADAWSHPELLMIDQNGKMEAESGVPPDAFSSTGQLWGNPLYRWESHEKTGYNWWIKRIKANLELCDVIRIDHFRGFEAYWEVPAGSETAMTGKWVKGPGQKFFNAIKNELGSDLPIIAEDLGVITKEVEDLRDNNGLMGMKILQFAFGYGPYGEYDTSNAYLPQNIGENSVVYTGTHDNDTTVGWFNSLDNGMKDYVRRYLECSDDQVLWSLIRVMLMTHARWAILPMQDILGLDSSARMNVPSTCGTSNWSWKMREEDFNSSAFGGIEYFTKLYGRYNFKED